MILHGILLRQVQLMPSLIKNSSKTHLHNKNKKNKNIYIIQHWLYSCNKITSMQNKVLKDLLSKVILSLTDYELSSELTHL